MSTGIRIVAALVLGCFTAALSAQPTANIARSVDPASMEALSGGTLTFWVSSQGDSEPRWTELVAELKTDYPTLRVEWRAFQSDAFLIALSEAQRDHRAPDVVFADNYAREGPLLQRKAGRIMTGSPRRYGRGWWTILNDAPNRRVAEAFFIWLEQPKDWQPKHPATQLLTATDETQIRTIATQTIESLGTFPVKFRQNTLDPDIAQFSWNLTRPRSVHEDERQTYTAVAEQVGGNSRLAFVLLSTLEQSENSFGLLHSFLVLRKGASGWKMLLLEPRTTLPWAEQMFAKFAGLGLNNTASQGAAGITLLSPVDGAHATRFPKTDIAFEQRSPGELTGIESQFFDPARQEWSPSNLYWVEAPEDAAGVTRMPAPFGVGMQPHRWRVWSVTKDGIVTLSEWRVINFAN